MYGSGPKKNLVRVQKVLNFAARVIFGRKKFDHVSDLWDRLGWLRPQQLVDTATINLVQKVITSGQPDALSALFRQNSGKRERKTRQDHLYVVPRCKTGAGQRRFSVRGPNLYNSLPTTMYHLRQPNFQRHLYELFRTLV